jgi:hypothetical protein
LVAPHFVQYLVISFDFSDYSNLDQASDVLSRMTSGANTEASAVISSHVTKKGQPTEQQHDHDIDHPKGEAQANGDIAKELGFL